MKKCVLLLLLILSLTPNVFALAYYRDISDVGTSASMIGSGGVQGYSETATSIIDAPTGLQYSGNSLSGMYLSYFDETQHFSAGISRQLFDHITVGIAAVYEHSASLDKTTTSTANEAVLQDTFSYDRMQVAAGLSCEVFTDVHLGLAWVGYMDKMDELTSKGSDLSASLLLKTPVVDVTVFGKNLLKQTVLYSDGRKELLASQTGVSFKTAPLPIFQLECLGEVKKIEGQTNLLTYAGVKGYLDSGKTLGLSAGVRDKPGVGTSKSSFTAGASLNLEGLIFEYAYDTNDIYQNSSQHYFSLNIHY